MIDFKCIVLNHNYSISFRLSGLNYQKIGNKCFSGPRGLQLQVFKAEVEQQRLIPTLRSFLKLYTSIPISKLAKFLDMHENEVRCCLMAFKHKKEVVSTFNQIMYQ